MNTGNYAFDTHIGRLQGALEYDLDGICTWGTALGYWFAPPIGGHILSFGTPVWWCHYLAAYGPKTHTKGLICTLGKYGPSRSWEASYARSENNAVS